MSASSSNKKITELSVDRLSALPDDILCYILSFLEMKEASITCLLSKRWQFLWIKLPGLRFFERVEDCWNIEEKVREFVNRVNRTLAICSRLNLDRFEVNFDAYDDGRISSDADVWIQFAMETKVKKFSLLLPRRWRRYHTLPQIMFSNPSWTCLALRALTMAPNGTIDWPSLTALCIEYVDLDDIILEKIFSGCPVLSSLELVFCRGFRRLEVNFPRLHRLAIKDDECEGYLEISAPYIRSFKIYWKYKYKRLCLENFISLVSAEIASGNNVYSASGRFYLNHLMMMDYTSELIMKENITQLIENIRHAKMLKLEGSFMEDLSSIAPNFQLPESKREYLELYADRRKRSVPEIVGLLESSPNLETLVIHCYKSENQDDPPGFPVSKDDLDCDLLHLKTVCFKNFKQPDIETNEMMLTMARILLKRAIVLEKMEFVFREIDGFSRTVALYRRIQKLLSYPRVSQKAVHFIVASDNGVHFSSLQPSYCNYSTRYLNM